MSADREAEGAALAAGTHIPAVDDFGNQYLAAQVPAQKPDWALADGTLRERLEYARDQHALAAQWLDAGLTFTPKPADWHRACADWYSGMLVQLDDLAQVPAQEQDEMDAVYAERNRLVAALAHPAQEERPEYTSCERTHATGTTHFHPLRVKHLIDKFEDRRAHAVEVQRAAPSESVRALTAATTSLAPSETPMTDERQAGLHGVINRGDHEDCDAAECGAAWLLHREELWRQRVLATEGQEARSAGASLREALDWLIDHSTPTHSAACAAQDDDASCFCGTSDGYAHVLAASAEEERLDAIDHLVAVQNHLNALRSDGPFMDTLTAEGPWWAAPDSELVRLYEAIIAASDRLDERLSASHAIP